MKQLTIDVWSDIACPWCYVGKRRLEAALARFEHAPQVEVRWRSFELDPSAPRALPPGVDLADRLAAKYRSSRAGAEAMIASMTETAAGEGIEMRFDRIRPGNTSDAHRLLHLAAERGRQDALKERLLRGYLCEGEPIGEADTLVRLAGEAGLDEREAARVLAGADYAREVREDEAEAAALGIRGVPCFVLARRFGVVGAQMPDALLRVLERVWAELPEEGAAPGPACDPGGCTTA